MIFKKLKIFLLIAAALFGNKGIAHAQNANAINIKFFADEKQVGIEGRKEIVKFLKQHRTGDMYEFEIHSLSDPLDTNLDMERLISVQGVFREYGVEIDKLVDAKVRFISGLEQKLIIIRKRKIDEK